MFLRAAGRGRVQRQKQEQEPDPRGRKENGKLGRGAAKRHEGQEQHPAGAFNLLA